MKKKVLITDYVHPILINGLNEKGYDVSYEPDFQPEELNDILPSLYGIVINSKIKMTAERIDLAETLKFIGRLGSGLEIIDLKYAAKRAVHVFNSPEGNRNAVAEHALGMLLCLSNNLIKSDREVRQKIWKREENRGFEISGMTVGILGFGNTGQSFARKLSGWTLDCVYCDPYVLNVSEDFAYIRNVSLDQLLQDSDIISLHLPLTPETSGMVNKDFIKACKQGIIIINTSRGSVVNTADLIWGLKEKYIKGACLDVFENEKPHNFTSEEHQLYNELYSMDNTVLSPHIAGWTAESLRKIAEVLLLKVSMLG